MATEIVVSHEFKFVYVENRKAASSTVRNILLHVFGSSFNGSCPEETPRHLRRLDQACTTLTITQSMLNEYYFFTFVRDPVSRFYSGIIQAFEGSLSFEEENCQGQMMDILDYIRDTNRVPEMHLESQAHALSSPVSVDGLFGMIDFDFIESTHQIAHVFPYLLDQIEVNAGKKLTIIKKQIAFWLALERHNAAGAKSPAGSLLTERVGACRSPALDSEIRAVFQQDFASGIGDSIAK